MKPAQLGGGAVPIRRVRKAFEQVAEQLRELAEQAQADELVVVTPSLDRARRTGSYVALAEAWAA